MKTFKLSLFIIAAVFGATCVRAQTADDIINKYINAIGGREVIGKIKSLYMEFKESPVKGGVASSGNVNFLAGKGWRIEDNTDGKKNILCVMDSAGWMGSQIQGSPAVRAQTMSKENYDDNKNKLEIEVPFGPPGAPFINYSEKGYKVELIGKETMDGISVYKLKLTNNANNEIDFYINANTYYLTKSVKHINTSKTPIEMTTVYSDYRKTDIGYAMPFSKTISLPLLDSGGIITTVTKEIVNSEIDPKIFEKP